MKSIRSTAFHFATTPCPLFLRGYNFRIPVLFFVRSPFPLPLLSVSLLLLVSPSLPPPARRRVGRGACIQNESHTHSLLSSPLLSLPRTRSHSLVANTPSFLPSILPSFPPCGAPRAVVRCCDRVSSICARSLPPARVSGFRRCNL